MLASLRYKKHYVNDALDNIASRKKTSIEIFFIESTVESDGNSWIRCQDPLWKEPPLMQSFLQRMLQIRRPPDSRCTSSCYQNKTTSCGRLWLPKRAQSSISWSLWIQDFADEVFGNLKESSWEKAPKGYRVYLKSFCYRIGKHGLLVQTRYVRNWSQSN